MKATIMKQALIDGDITHGEYMEHKNLSARMKRLERLSWAIAKGEVDPEVARSLSQQDIADILGVSQQLVSKSEKSGLAKARAAFKALKLDRHHKD